MLFLHAIQRSKALQDASLYRPRFSDWTNICGCFSFQAFSNENPSHDMKLIFTVRWMHEPPNGQPRNLKDTNTVVVNGDLLLKRVYLEQRVDSFVLYFDLYIKSDSNPVESLCASRRLTICVVRAAENLNISFNGASNADT